ncbi:MAG: hemerythrin domain-containing protein [Pseudomonadales bacterium]|nr:hemerythrin domain-containing protein [Pseudomonadales bacterium]
MQSTDNWLVHDHSMYEELLSQCQDAVDMEDWGTAEAAFEELIWHMKGHMAMEEEVLYPAYDARIPIPNGPTNALKDEHDNIVRQVTDMTHVLKSRDSEHAGECLSHLENLMMKHHEKEEDIFLPMASLLLEQDRAELLKQLNAFDSSKPKRKWPV